MQTRAMKALIIGSIVGLLSVAAGIALMFGAGSRHDGDYDRCAGGWEALRAKQCTDDGCRITYDPDCKQCNANIDRLMHTKCGWPDTGHVHIRIPGGK